MHHPAGGVGAGGGARRHGGKRSALRKSVIDGQWPVHLSFRETTTFTRQITALLSDDDLSALEWALMARPDRGDLIRGSGGLRKIRWQGRAEGSAAAWE